MNHARIKMKPDKNFDDVDLIRLEDVRDEIPVMPGPDDAYDRVEMAATVSSAVSTLRPQEEKVIRMHFGLDDGVERTFKEIGFVFGRSSGRIQQIAAKALRKLRYSSKSKYLTDFYQQPVYRLSAWALAYRAADALMLYAAEDDLTVHYNFPYAYHEVCNTVLGWVVRLKVLGRRVAPTQLLGVASYYLGRNDMSEETVFDAIVGLAQSVVKRHTGECLEDVCIPDRVN